MKGIGVSLMLGLLLACVLIFAYRFRTPHSVGTRWNTVDRGLDQVDLGEAAR
jgi:hypothetical protein